MTSDKKSEFSIEDKKKLVAAGEKIRNSEMTEEEQQAALKEILEAQRKTVAMLDGLPTAERDQFKAGVQNYLSSLIIQLQGREHTKPDGTVVIEEGSITQMQKLGIELENYLRGEHDNSDAERLIQEHNRLAEEFREISIVVSRLQQNYGRNTEEELIAAKGAWEKLKNADKKVQQLTAEIKEKSTNINKLKLKIQKVERTVRRLHKGRVAAVFLCALMAADAAASIGYTLSGNKNAYQENYTIGETVNEITEGYNGDLESTFYMMTADELMNKKSDVRNAQNEKSEQEFADMLKVIDEYIVVANKKTRTPDEERRYHELAIIIDDYQGYVDLEGNPIGFNETMRLMAKAKLADAMRDAGCRVENINEDIKLSIHKPEKNIPEYTSLYVKYIDENGERQERRITDETWIIMANSNFLSKEIVGLTQQLNSMSANPTVDEKVEHMQVIAGMISTGIVFDAKTGKFKMESDREEEKPKNVTMANDIQQLGSDDGR